MTENEDDVRVIGEFDFTPHPRILAMLGEINFSQVNCLAEFIDNSIDGFLHAKRSNNPIHFPSVTVDLPSTENSSSRITISDNGPGMKYQDIENAAKAGWSGNNSVDNLGLFGMGFNISMARLSNCATIWSTKEGDKEWHGTEINIRAMQSGKGFSGPHLTRPKDNPGMSQTEIVISELKPAQLKWFAKRNNRALIKKKLAAMYSAMLRPNGAPIAFNLIIGSQPVQVQRYCVWGDPTESEERIVRTSSGDVNTFQNINQSLSDKKYCEACWIWFAEEQGTCSVCGQMDTIQLRKRKITGWIGVQRYTHPVDYGLDFLRNGRKIEVASKDLFSWVNDEGEKTAEYPIDDLRRGGRIVGEIHLDHCKVPYTKDRFERTDTHWNEMITAIRGVGPMLPRLRSDLGFSDNNAPLYRLYQAFRRSTPTSGKQGDWKRIFSVSNNGKAQEYADRFHKNDPQYQSDEKWYQLILEQEEELPGGGGPVGGGDEGPVGGGDDDDDPFDGGDEGPVDGGDEGPIGGGERPPNRVMIESLTDTYRSDVAEFSMEVEVFRVEDNDLILENGNPWVLKFEQQKFTLYINPGHPIFSSRTMSLSDAVLTNLAYRATLESTDCDFVSVLCELRMRYDPNRLEGADIFCQARELLNLISAGFSGHTSKQENDSLWGSLDEDSQEAVRRRCATLHLNPDEVIGGGDFLKHCERDALLKFFEQNPELFFDEKFWKVKYSDLGVGNQYATNVELQRKGLVEDYMGLIRDVIWLERQEQDIVVSEDKTRLLRAMCSMELLKVNQA